MCGKDIVSPVATSDYLFNTAEDGSGTNITSDLVVTGILGVNDAELSFTNNNAVDGYITFLQIRGKPIYVYDKVSRIAKDSAKIDRWGLSQFVYDMPYQPPPFTAYLTALTMLWNYMNPTSRAEAITFSTNSDHTVGKFLALDCNSEIFLTETQTGIDAGIYYVQGWNFNVIGYNDTTGALIQETLYLFKEEPNAYPDVADPDYY